MIFFSIYIYYREQEDSSLNDESGEANDETIAKPSVMLKRRRTLPNVESTQVGTQQLNPDTPFQPNVESTRVGSQELNPNTPFHPSVESSRVGSQELNQNTPFHPNVESTRVETQELSQDTVSTKTKKVES